MEIFLTKYWETGSIVPVDATIDARTGIATETDSRVKHVRGCYEVTLDAATAEVRARVAKAVKDAQQRAEYLSSMPVTLDWFEQGKPRFRLLTD